MYKIFIRNLTVYLFLITQKKKSIGIYILGCVLFSLGAKLFITSKLGVDPLDVLVIGMAQHMGSPSFGMGFCSSLIAIFFLSWWSVWSRKFPPLMPFFTTAFVGFLIDFWNYLKLEDYLTLFFHPYLILILGALTCSYASSLIIMSGIGIRIMDLIAIKMVLEWKWSFFKAKMLLEMSLFSLGWVLGGPIGVGTCVFLLMVGPLIQPFMWMNERFLKLYNFGISRGKLNYE